ncbi:MAG: hypothetical protein P1Q69_00710 [Candidatus Thorarchaeota archaeon]|nr:hypothetical protein [Candidatus Thorarchaeota archaeon]
MSRSEKDVELDDDLEPIVIEARKLVTSCEDILKKRDLTEEDFKIGFTQALHESLRQLDIEHSVKFEKNVFKSLRADALYPQLMIEYKKPGVLSDIRSVEKVVEQISEYLKGIMKKEPNRRPVGVAMMAAGAFACATGGVVGIPSILFGLDMVTSNTLGHSVLDVSLKGMLLIGLSGGGIMSDMRGGSSRDVSFVFEEGFSFFQFTGDHLTNLILTQLTFMIVGAALTGFSGLSRFLVQQIEKNPGTGGTFASLTESGTAGLRDIMDLASKASGLPNTMLLAEYLLHNAQHLITGAVFLYTLGAIGSAFGDAGLIAEVLLQVAILAQVTLGVYYSWKSMNYQEEVSSYKEVSEQFGELPDTVNTIKLRLQWSALEQASREYGYFTSRYKMVALGLSIGTIALQYATIAGSL